MVSDAHIHLNALSSGPQLAQYAARVGAHLFAVTCSPTEFSCASQRFKGSPNVLVGLGLHPWELSKPDAGEMEQLESAFARQASDQRWLGELGLDFHQRFSESAYQQVLLFESACRIAAGDRRVLSLHAHSSELEVIRILEDTGAARSCTCILHGFAGGGLALTRALEAGCMVSLGPRQLASKRGREYAHQLPAQRLLLETDADASSPQRDPSPAEWAAQMDQLLSTLDELRSCSMQGQLEENWHRVFEEL
ncbi:MAG: TatD family hydrolase [Coriobacteriales bacterium]